MKPSERQGRARTTPVITQARIEPLDGVPFHTSGPVTRWLMASQTIDPRVGVHIALHEMSGVEPATRSYCAPHVHDCDELNVFHTTSELEVEVRLDDAVHLVKAPASVVIPAGTVHAANVRSGSGFMVVVLLEGRYRALAPNDPDAEGDEPSPDRSRVAASSRS